jgi:hypothetical protein
MGGEHRDPQVFRILCGDAVETRHTPYGSVGTVFSGEGIEAVWVSKQDEVVESGWFSQSKVDLLLVIQGELYVEFERSDLAARVLASGDLLILPANTRCRAYRWPRDRKEATVFLAAYPAE